MATKIALWISTLFHPITNSPSIGRADDRSIEKRDVPQFSKSFEWETTQLEDRLVNTSPDIGRASSRKESIGGGIIVREQLIRDLE